MVVFFSPRQPGIVDQKQRGHIPRKVITVARSRTTLSEKFPNIAAQWDDSKNGDITPEDVAPGSHKKLWWVCDKGHSWEAVIKNRTRRKSGCPYCSGRRASSNNSIKTTFPEFFQDMERYGKQDVRPEQLKKRSRTVVHLQCGKGHIWEASPWDYKNISGGMCPYCCHRKLLQGFNDLATLYPDVAQLWDQEGNGMSASDVIARVGKNGAKYHWSCDNGHHWERTIGSAIKHPGCPVCKNQEIVVGYNDISVFAPELFSELDGRHKTVDQLEKIFPYSNGKLTWHCPQGHGTYRSAMSKRMSGQGCPVCAGNITTPGINDIATVSPDLMSQWDFERNDISPSAVSSGTRKIKVWWKCDLDHSYQATPGHRTSGNGCPYCSNKKVLEGFNDLATMFPDVAQQWDYQKNPNGISPKTVVGGSGLRAWWVCGKGHSWDSSVYRRTVEGLGCPRCSHIVSHGEKEVQEYISSIIGCDNVRKSNRTILDGRELDVYIPSRGVAIEYNGLYWHSEATGKDKRYHYDKWLDCKDAGIHLITIWEDEWRDKRNLVEKMLAHKLGVSNEQKVFARKTTVVELDSDVAREFCDTHHIQGASVGSFHYGLQDSAGELVAVSTWRKQGKDLYLNRYCTSTTVVGGMGKLLKAGKDWARNNDCYRIVTFADHQVSDGNLYEKLGFVADKELDADYRYLVSGQRKHKFGYRLERFRNDPALEYQEGLTESQLADLNGLRRIWDCGKTRYVMEV